MDGQFQKMAMQPPVSLHCFGAFRSYKVAYGKLHVKDGMRNGMEHGMEYGMGKR